MTPAQVGPVRMCAGCRGRAPQSELLRLGLEMQDGLAVVRPRGRRDVAGGRSAYLHRDAKCCQEALRTRGLRRAFRIPASIQAELVLGNMLGDRERHDM